MQEKIWTIFINFDYPVIIVQTTLAAFSLRGHKMTKNTLHD